MNWFMPSFRAAFLTLGLVAGAMGARAQLVLPLEFRHVLTNDTKLNFQSQAGVPISTTVGSPPGSNGQQPTANESFGSFATPTAKQFQNLLSLGAVPGLKQADWIAVSNSPTLQAGVTPLNASVADQMRLPRGESTLPGGMIILRRAAVGMPYLSRQVSFAFGQVIPPPSVNEKGELLPGPNAGSYWLPEPHASTGHTNAGYYWSPHARLIYAIQPGPMQITWAKAEPFNTGNLPAYSNPGGGASFRTNGANIFLLYTENYLVSGSASKAPRKIYWTQESFRNVGKPVAVPTARVGAVNIVYNNNFPKTVPTVDAFRAIGQSSPADGSTNAALVELRTLWYEQGSLLAYNREGRVFVELLGDLREDGQTYQPLGTEIVDVSKQAIPQDVEVELGERVVPPEGGTLEELDPEPLIQVSGQLFAFQRNIPGTDKVELYATRETRNLNDYLVHWMETGEASLKWPKLFGRYQFAWPREVTKYSLYVRPAVTTEDEAKLTAVPLHPEHAPTIDYQDPLDAPRAKLTPDNRFYSFLNATYPAHRTLLRFTAGDNIAFERVFSWLDGNLRTTNFVASSVATNLSAWNGTTFVWPNELSAPRVINATAAVGQRILAPTGEPGADGGETYWAGYLNQSVGTAFNPMAYKDPFEQGLVAANRSSIIPVNAIPGADRLEVWWFRPNSAAAGLNSGNGLLGFRTNHWPSVLGQYQIVWPSNPREIVLASKLGGTGLSTSEALGTIYYQNQKGKTGYNPNEEHALMNGGTPYATRDDLNITTQTNGEYSSHPFVLVDYVAPDGRPAMAAFKVLREKPEAGWVFDYVVPAGQLLQPPPPLTFLPKPVEGGGDNAINYNTEPANAGGDLPGGWTGSDATGPFGHYQSFTFRDRRNDFWVYRGLHAGLPDLQAGTYQGAGSAFAPLTNATAVVGEPFSLTVHVSRQDEYLSLTANDVPQWLTANGLTLTGTPATGDVGTNTFELVVRDLYDNSRRTNTLTLEVVASGTVVGQAPLALVSSNQYTGSVLTFTNRPPFLAGDPAPSNSFTLRYYYKTLAGFAWPGVSQPPEVGSIVPYLRPKNSDGAYLGDAADKNTDSLEIVYRPVWPVRDPKDSSKPLPSLPYAATLTRPAFNLPGVRDFKTAQILYQQSIAQDLPTASVSAVLHDPTRAKYADLTLQFADTGKLPAGIKTELYQGKVFFPNLPPHLATRVYFDPTRGSKGSLVLIGEFVQEILGESYLQLNVLRGSDLEAVQALCPAADTDNRPKWVALVNALATDVETFHENPSVPGTYIPNDSLTRSVGVEDLANITDANTARDSYAISATGPGGGYVTLLENSGSAFTEAGDPVAMHIFKVGGSLHPGELKVITSANPLNEFLTMQHSADLAGRFGEYEYEWKIGAPVDGFPPVTDATMSRYLPLTSISTNIPRYTLGGAGIQALSDNYVVMRFRPISPSHPLYAATPTDADWSPWTSPALAEGWIKRVLAGINPFNQRVNDLFNNQVNTDVSLLTQAGRRWEGDVALNLDSINNYGLIEIYETVLRRGRSLSIESGYNYGPANDALLLAAGYLSDLYMMVGNEAWADAANPTIGIGTADNTYGDIATSLFSFRGQLPTLLEEELALLRGRDDFFLPGVEVTPVYNRLVWNYTRGIDAGEVIYALNYNIQEKPDSSPDGIINAADAARMFPQGHGDAYGHYLTALKGYYSLLLNPNFDWVPRIEAVNILGKPVSVDYQDERKFAAAAAAGARAGRQIFDLTWRNDYQPVHQVGWKQFASTRENAQRSYVNAADGSTNHTVRNWGADHWASRVGQGTYLNWVVGNAILPDVDPIPTHEGIQKVDRTTVPELAELVLVGNGLQTALDNAEGGLSPLGVPEDGLAFDVNPNAIVGVDGGAHFEQIYQRATKALNNAVIAFDDAKDVTRLMRSEQDSLAELQSSIAQQELAYTNALIELYGTPYSDDIGVGRTYKQGFAGPDLLHYMYVDDVTLYERRNGMWDPNAEDTFPIDIQALPDYWGTKLGTNNWLVQASDPGYTLGEHYIEYKWGPHGFLEKPTTWAGKRSSPGRLQQAISEIIAAHDNLYVQITAYAMSDKEDLDKAIQLHNALQTSFTDAATIEANMRSKEKDIVASETSYAIANKVIETIAGYAEEIQAATAEALPKNLVFGLSTGGDLMSPGRGALYVAMAVVKQVLLSADTATFIGTTSFQAARQAELIAMRDDVLALDRHQELKQSIVDIGAALKQVQGDFIIINEALRRLDDAQRAYQSLVAEGDRIQAERMVFRQRSAALIQGYRTRDAAFRVFRNEKLERYKTLFDLSARYALLAANAYDYETGLLGTQTGRNFKAKMIASRALGVVADGEPQFAGSNAGDPGLSSALAEMKADWDVLRGRLGFNQPDPYSTTVSYRTEKERILPGSEGDTNWKDVLNAARVPDILSDPDVRRHCMQVDNGSGLPVPGIILTFSTTIADGYNLFGHPLAAGDHAYSPTSFATKLFGVGVAFEGYRGMGDPEPADDATGGGAGDPSAWFLDPMALSATPYVYLIPVGVDSMRSPPLGDASTVRTWNVQDLAIPMPFNIGGSDFSTQKVYQSADSLTEPLFSIRKHQAFRPVSDAGKFELVFYSDSMPRFEYVNNRLIGRSVWNSQWKLIIPGRTLLNDPNEGLDRFIRTVKDVKLHLQTYSYSGN